MEDTEQDLRRKSIQLMSDNEIFPPAATRSPILKPACAVGPSESFTSDLPFAAKLNRCLSRPRTERDRPLCGLGVHGHWPGWTDIFDPSKLRLSTCALANDTAAKGLNMPNFQTVLTSLLQQERTARPGKSASSRHGSQCLSQRKGNKASPSTTKGNPLSTILRFDIQATTC